MSFIDQLVLFFSFKKKDPQAAVLLKEPPPVVNNQRDAEEYLQKLETKMDSLASRFAKGGINRKQFQELYAFYQAETTRLEKYISQNPDSAHWRDVINEGKSVIIRRRLKAQLLGFSIYSNISGMPLRTLGRFGLDPAMFLPILHAYQAVTKETFGAGMRSTEISDGQWLTFMPGYFSTTMALFTTEPSGEQIRKLTELHKIFERANERELVKVKVEPARLVVPHEFFLKHPL